MFLFVNNNPEEFLLFVSNFTTTFVVTRTLDTGVKIRYLHTLVHVEVLHQFDSLYSDMESTETINAEYNIKVLVLYFPPINSFSKQKRPMCHGMRNNQFINKTTSGTFDCLQ